MAGIYREWKKASGWLKEGHRVALATVIETWGSSPRPMGSVLMVRDDEVFEGSVSGGCVEGTVIVEAIDCLKTGKTKTLEFKAGSDDVWVPGLSCGGKISIFLNPVKETNAQVIHGISGSLEKGCAGVVAANLKTGAMDFVSREINGNKGLPARLDDMAANCLNFRKSEMVLLGDEKFFLNYISPQPKLYIFGAVHIAQTLVPMAQMLGFQVFLSDPREAFAEASRFPGQSLFNESPDEFFRHQKLTPDCAVVTLTHDPKLDEPALAAALKSDCFYIGALGSRKTHKTRLRSLKKKGFGETQLKRISGPVGLSIGAKTPEEISISILAEIIETMRAGSNGKR